MISLVKPPALKNGDTLGIIAPAGAVVAGELERGMRRLERLGFQVKAGSSVSKVFRNMAGSDQERAQDILQMFSDPEIRGIVCARGGYGSARVIPYLDPEIIVSHPKVFVGCSDVTLLLLYLTQRCNLVTFHGPMAGPNFGNKESALTDTFFLKVLTESKAIGSLPLPKLKILKGGQAKGRLTGGCLSVLCSAIGTSYEPKTEGSVLFLEDVREPPYRIDRMLTQLRDAGKFNAVRAVLFGEMTDCQPEKQAGYQLEEIILDVLTDFTGPVLFGIPSGHGRDNITLPMGIEVRVSANRSREESGLLCFDEEAVSANRGDDTSGGSV